MDEETKAGAPWESAELDLIVEDYFEMLTAELSGEPYVKSHHSRHLMARIDRSHRSVEFKHQNISAVLGELGLPWIPGYRPKVNYQGAIIDAVGRYLQSREYSVEQLQAQPPARGYTPLEVFVEPPLPLAASSAADRRLLQLIAEVDPAERDRRNRALGRAGEEFVYGLEQTGLAEQGRDDLAAKVRWVSRDDGDTAGYDVLSFDTGGAERRVEVKTTYGCARTPFYISRNECLVAEEQAAHWRLYRLYNFANGPQIFTIKPPLNDTVRLTPEVWRASPR